MNIEKYLNLAAEVSRIKDDDRTFFHGAVGIRRDGVMVAACNGNPKYPTPEHHCEFRITRKLGRSGTVFLVRTTADGQWAASMPCNHCQNRLRFKEVSRIYYTTGPGTYDWWRPMLDFRPTTNLTLVEPEFDEYV